MLKREGLIWPVVLLAVTLLLFIAVGTLYDYPLSSFLYPGQETVFGSIFAAIGELPAYFALHSAGIMLICHRGKRTRFQDVLLLLCGIALLLLGILGQFCEFVEDLPRVPMVIAILVTLALFALNYFFTLLLMREAAREDILRFVMAVLFVCGVSMLAANLLKYPWARPRMWFLASEPEAAFVPWYRPDPAVKKAYAALGVGRDAFRSFPSGHTVTAAASLLWTLYPSMHRYFEGKGRLLFLFSLLWTLFVTLSRLTMGAHFLSDVAISWMFTLILYTFSIILFYRDNWIYLLFYKLLS